MRGWLLRWFPLATRAGRAFGERFTPLGKWMLATCALAGIFSADPTRTHAFLLFGATLALLAVAFVTSLLWRPRVSARRDLPPQVTAGQTGSYVIVLHNAGRRALHEVRIADRLRLRYPTRAEFKAEIADAPEDNWFDRRVGFLRWQRLRQRLQGATLATETVDELSPGQARRVTLALTPLRRGWLEFDAVRLLQPDPLGLCYAVLTLPLDDHLLSRPPAVAMPTFTIPLPAAGQRAVGAARRRGDGLEIFALRDYRPGDPPRHIDWRSSAKRGQPLVRQFAAETELPPRVLVDCAAPRQQQQFESLVTIAASLLVATAGRPGALALQLLDADGQAPIHSVIGDALDRLATLDATPGDTLPAYAVAAPTRSPGIPLVLVCAHWDETRAGVLAQWQTTTEVLVLCTDPTARASPQVRFIDDPQTALRALHWVPASCRRAS